MKPDIDLTQYTQAYTEQSFWQKVKTYCQNIGVEALTAALTLYYAAKDPATPEWVKVLAYSALGYFISPIDLIPDFIPLVGYSDDLAILAGTLLALKAYVTKQHEDKAAEKVCQFFN